MITRNEALEIVAAERGCAPCELIWCNFSVLHCDICTRLRELLNVAGVNSGTGAPVKHGRNEAVKPSRPTVDAVPASQRGSILPDDDKARLEYPMADGLLYYFPAALAEVARVSKIGNEQHNPGQPLHWARGKSTDHENKILRHLAETGTKDNKGVRHSARLAWRALALLQEELEREEGAPLPKNAKY